MQILVAFIKHEFLEVLPPTIFFFLAYCAMRELVRVVGRDRVLHMFFGDPKTLSPSNPADGP